MTICTLCDHPESTHTRHGCTASTGIAAVGPAAQCGCPSYEPEQCDVCAGYGCAECYP